MSKCDISLNFKNDQDQFRSDQPVTGTVDIQVNKDVDCRSLVIAGNWKTHGRGNRDSGRYATQSLYKGELQAGKSYSYPFQIPADKVPLTYRGKLINLDHYVDVRIDLPWARDPKKRTEFILLPGSAGTLPVPIQPTSDGLGAQIGRAVATVLSVILCVTGILTLCLGIGLLLLPAGLAIGYFALRKQLAERRLGEVQIACDSHLIAPGDKLPITVSFTPRKSGKINGIQATLMCTERAVSGSGSTQETHTATLHEQDLTLSGPESFGAQAQISFRGHVQVPNIDAYSFHTGDNSVSWTIKIKIDIPKWPDWFEVVNLALVPRPLLHDEPPAEIKTTATSAADATAPIVIVAASAQQTVQAKPANQDTPEVEAPEKVAPEPEPEPAPEPEPEPEPEPAVSLPETCDLLNAAGHNSTDQDRVVAALANQSFPLTLSITKIASTYNWDKDSPYSDGKTLTGLLDGTEHQVEIQIPGDRNQQIDGLRTGDTWSGTGQITGRDSLFHRVKMNAD